IEFQQKYESRGFTVLGVAMDDEGKSVVEPFVAKKQFDVDGHSLTMNYPIVLGNDDLAAKFGGLIGLPTSLVISRDGRLVKRFIGLVNHDTIVKEIEGQLKLLRFPCHSARICGNLIERWKSASFRRSVRQRSKN